MEAIKHSLGNLLKELEQIRATLTVHIDVCYETLDIFRSFMNLPWPLVTQYLNSTMTQLSYVRSSCGPHGVGFHIRRKHELTQHTRMRLSTRNGYYVAWETQHPN